MKWLKNIYLLSILCLFISRTTGSCQQKFIDSLKRYETGMQKAAVSWKKGDYSLALDIVGKSRSELLPAMPAPADSFAWLGFSAMKTYTLLFTRLIEHDLHRSRNESRLSQLSLRQIGEWSDILLDQGREWYKLPVASEGCDQFRRRWLSRFSRVIKKSQQLKPGE